MHMNMEHCTVQSQCPGVLSKHSVAALGPRQTWGLAAPGPARERDLSSRRIGLQALVSAQDTRVLVLVLGALLPPGRRIGLQPWQDLGQDPRVGLGRPWVRLVWDRGWGWPLGCTTLGQGSKAKALLTLGQLRPPGPAVRMAQDVRVLLHFHG